MKKIPMPVENLGLVLLEGLATGSFAMFHEESQDLRDRTVALSCAALNRSIKKRGMGESSCARSSFADQYAHAGGCVRCINRFFPDFFLTLTRRGKTSERITIQFKKSHRHRSFFSCRVMLSAGGLHVLAGQVWIRFHVSTC